MLLFFIGIVIIGEVSLRLFSNDQKEYSDKSIMDEELGWLPKADYSSSYKMQTHGDNPIEWEVNYETANYGFRTWPDIDSEKPKVLLIGDSFVQAVEVSTDKTFYSYIADSLDVEIFAFGQAGYGTLQQKMILSKYINQIDPKLIILQTCDNDFVDNHAPLEHNSSYKVGLRRPYYDLEGSLVYKKTMASWKEFVDNSQFLGLLRRKIENAFFKIRGKSSQDLMAELGDKYQPYSDAQKITSIVLKEMKKVAGETPLVAFSASSYEPQLSAFRKLSESAEIPFYDSIGVKIIEASWHMKKVFSSDGFHWSEDGHHRVANLLITDLKESGITDSLKSES